jgi:glucosamine kinase
MAGGHAAALVQWCEGAGQRAYAELAPLVFEAAEQGDAGAAALLDAAATELAALVRPLDPPAQDEPLPIVLTGGIGTRLRARWPAALRQRLVDAQGDSAEGALALVRASLADDGWVP